MNVVWAVGRLLSVLMNVVWTVGDHSQTVLMSWAMECRKTDVHIRMINRLVCEQVTGR